MAKKQSNWLFWILAVLITLGAAYYQKMTGPTYPETASFTINQKEFSFNLPRSHGGTTDCPVELNGELNRNDFELVYRRYPTNEEYSVKSFQEKDGVSVAFLPNQPPAGKLQYFIRHAVTGIRIPPDHPVTIRFKGEVPGYILMPHVIFMFAAMLLSNLSALLAVAKRKKYRLYAMLAFLSLAIGGMILGPIVQKFAFGEFWTGIPFGYDLTDNKTLIAFIFWTLAFILNLKGRRPWVVVLAAVILLAVYSIPHSMMGSELNYSSGQITTG